MSGVRARVHVQAAAKRVQRVQRWNVVHKTRGAAVVYATGDEHGRARSSWSGPQTAAPAPRGGTRVNVRAGKGSAVGARAGLAVSDRAVCLDVANLMGVCWLAHRLRFALKRSARFIIADAKPRCAHALESL